VRAAALKAHAMRARQRTRWLRAFQAVRQRSLQLAAPLSAEDCCAQSMPDASPVKWHLAHTTWFFETFILEPREPASRPSIRPSGCCSTRITTASARSIRVPQRGLLTRPSLDEVRPTAPTSMRAWALLEAQAATISRRWRRWSTLGLQHEQQHQELMLTDVKHLLSPRTRCARPTTARRCRRRRRCAAGLPRVRRRPGRDRPRRARLCFDNELPRHRQYVAPFALASRLVTNGEYLAFIEAGGYRDPALWLAEGWDKVAPATGAPLYWRRGEGRQLAANSPCTACSRSIRRARSHVAVRSRRLCALAGARLPTEAEWEFAARLAASAAGRRCIRRLRRRRPAQMFGACWQWTSSSYAPYPGYAPAPGAIGEYNGKFMVNQYVLRGSSCATPARPRGSSCATPAGHARASYRNFFPAGARWQFSRHRAPGRRRDGAAAARRRPAPARRRRASARPGSR
jgi:ergothioneine biosynthesis protein EgtB